MATSFDDMGTFTADPDESVSYRLRDVLSFCKERGIDVEDISDEDLRRFEVG